MTEVQLQISRYKIEVMLILHISLLLLNLDLFINPLQNILNSAVIVTSPLSMLVHDTGETRFSLSNRSSFIFKPIHIHDFLNMLIQNFTHRSFISCRSEWIIRDVNFYSCVQEATCHVMHGLKSAFQIADLWPTMSEGLVLKGKHGGETTCDELIAWCAVGRRASLFWVHIFSAKHPPYPREPKLCENVSSTDITDNCWLHVQLVYPFWCAREQLISTRYLNQVYPCGSWEREAVVVIEHSWQNHATFTLVSTMTKTSSSWCHDIFSFDRILWTLSSPRPSGRPPPSYTRAMPSDGSDSFTCVKSNTRNRTTTTSCLSFSRTSQNLRYEDFQALSTERCIQVVKIIAAKWAVVQIGIEKPKHPFSLCSPAAHFWHKWMKT